MPDEDKFPNEEAWDEYKWERFLQQQDQNTEKYFQLLEKYMDHPDCDEIVAEEMGWTIFEAAEQEQEHFENFLTEAVEYLSDEEEQEYNDEFEEFTHSAVYEDTLRLHRWINRLLDHREDLREHPEAVRFATRSAVCGAKLAAGLCGHDTSEIGMTIAYLKRALKAANDALDAMNNLLESGLIDRRRANHARRLVFKIRDRIVDNMGTYRLKWRNRNGNA
ncbi:MAG: hypothetical protein EBY32_18260 [Proteobacteria bacterium]|nr:hypothetical protein [Pseudomonadota bacterium]